MRRKIYVQGMINLPEELCGVKDSAVVDFMVWDAKSPFGRPMLCFKFCPWCGKPWERTGAVQEAPRADHE
jgi:hypothetical protein